MNNIENNNFRAAYQAALKLLALKDRTRKEITEKLKRKGFSSDLANQIVSQLEEEGLVNDCKVSQTYFNELWNYSNAGPTKILNKSKEKGLDLEFIKAMINNLTEEELKTKVKNIIKKRMKQGDNKAKLRIYRYLLNQGFSYSLINRAFAELGYNLTNQQE